MSGVAQANRVRFADTHPTAARVGRFFGRRIPGLATGSASAFGFLALSSAAAPVSGIMVATAVVMLITEAVSQPIFTHFRIKRLGREQLAESKELKDQVDLDLKEIASLRENVRRLHAQLEEGNVRISQAAFESRAAQENVIFRLQQRIPTLSQMGELLDKAIKLSRGLMEAGVALPRMRKLGKGVLEEIELFSNHRRAIEEEIQDLQTVIQQIKSGNTQGLQHLSRSHYIYVRDLGKGGMGKAQLYYYAPQDAWVVIKTILPEYQQDPELIERFRREATIAKELQHVNLARGFGYGGDEFVEGEFSGSLKINELCKAIDCDRYDWLPQTANHTVERLNELLRFSDFFEVCWQVKKPDVRLPMECLRLIEKTAESRKKSFADLSEIERSNIIRLNRLLLEAGYPESCPRSHLYSITEFIRGKSLDDLLYVKKADPQNPEQAAIEAARKLSAVKAARLALRCLDALAYMNGRNIIHRDLKPENIMIDADGTPKLIDFGLAREVGDIDKMTRTATALGTQIYMAPEQLKGERDLTGKIDLYALGEIVFEALTTVTIFGFNNQVDLFRAKFSNEYIQNAVETNEDVPPALKEILIRLLAVEKENRPTHQEAYEAFQHFLASQEGTAVGF